MQCRFGIVLWSIITAGALTGCATGGSSGGYQTFMQRCLADAKTAEERSTCAWENASRMADGGK